MEAPDESEFSRGFYEFEAREERDAMYKVATFLLDEFWGQPADMADGLGVLLLTWNQAFYRTQSFDFDELEMSLERHLEQLEKFRNREIDTFSESDVPAVERIFTDFLNATQLQSGSRAGYQSPVGVAKGLHLLAPEFFPLWDREIAKAYGYSTTSDSNPEDYLKFIWDMKQFASEVSGYDLPDDRSVLKLIDEYNYSKHTQEWV